MNKKWFHCPVCNKKNCMIDFDRNIEGVFIKCPMCKREIEIINKIGIIELGSRSAAAS